ncbi:MAG TPA: hypothetical protein ENI29_09495 [bacterium]|nr:hypothetical protein [bacterium]
MTVKEDKLKTQLSESDKKSYIKIDWGRQGGVIAGYLIVLLGYYGIIANMVLFDIYGDWLSFTDLSLFSSIEIVPPGGVLPTGFTHVGFFPKIIFYPGRDILFWSYITYLPTYFLPPLLLFLVCFVLTYKEDIPHYGIKASIWLVPFLIAEGFILNAIMFGFSLESVILKFGSIWGYLDIIILFCIVISGSLAGMKVKKLVIRKRTV